MKELHTCAVLQRRRFRLLAWAHAGAWSQSIVANLGTRACAVLLNGMTGWLLAGAGAQLLRAGLRRLRLRRAGRGRGMPVHGSMSSQRDLTVVTFNVRGVMDRWTERAPVLRDCLSELNPDVVCFQEVLTGQSWSLGAQFAGVGMIQTAVGRAVAPLRARQCLRPAWHPALANRMGSPGVPLVKRQAMLPLRGQPAWTQDIWPCGQKPLACESFPLAVVWCLAQESLHRTRGCLARTMPCSGAARPLQTWRFGEGRRRLMRPPCSPSFVSGRLGVALCTQGNVGDGTNCDEVLGCGTGPQTLDPTTASGAQLAWTLHRSALHSLHLRTGLCCCPLMGRRAPCWCPWPSGWRPGVSPTAKPKP
jgi:hypothetical protein